MFANARGTSKSDAWAPARPGQQPRTNSNTEIGRVKQQRIQFAVADSARDRVVQESEDSRKWQTGRPLGGRRRRLAQIAPNGRDSAATG
jgi:hypothetical protein